MKAAERGNIITVVAFASASGRFIPPFFIFEGRQRQEQELKVQLGPEGSESANSPRGLMTKEVFVEWMHHFVHHVKPSENHKVSPVLALHLMLPFTNVMTYSVHRYF